MNTARFHPASPLIIDGWTSEKYHAKLLLESVKKHGVVIIKGMTADANRFMEFGRFLGRPQQRYIWDPLPRLSETFKWISDVRYQPEASGKESSLFTRKCSPLRLHTARASACAKAGDSPRLFMMLMVNKGELSDPWLQGYSCFSRLDEAILLLSRDLNSKSETDNILELLKITPITTEDPYPDEPVIAPLLCEGENGRFVFRYWEHIRGHAKGTPANLALLAFDKALTSASFRYSLDSGDLVLVDNHRVAHGRGGFPGWIMGENGQKQLSSRLLYNLHVFADF